MASTRSLIVRDLVGLCASFRERPAAGARDGYHAAGPVYETALRGIAERYGGSERGLDKALHWLLADAGMDYVAGRRLSPEGWVDASWVRLPEPAAVRRVARRKAYAELIEQRAAAGRLMQGPAYAEGPTEVGVPVLAEG